MENSRLVNFIQIKEFLQGTTAVDLSLTSRKEKYGFVKKTFDEFKYTTLSKKQKGVVRRYIRKVTGYSKAQIARVLASSFLGDPYREEYKRHVFNKKYTASDILLLAKTDNLHGRLNGIATKLILQKESIQDKRISYG